MLKLTARKLTTCKLTTCKLTTHERTNIMLNLKSVDCILAEVNGKLYIKGSAGEFR